MKDKKILFITQEITPYVSTSQMAVAGRTVPQGTQERGYEIRTFMPRWGHINERRNQLHEVIRLSGMNIIVDESDHPLIIKVASIQPARMQVYFIDNDDYFHKRHMLCDDKGKEYTDNIERAVFYARGVLETVKKLRWTPDVIVCQGWISAVVPFYIKHAYEDEPTFQNTKVVFTAFDEVPSLAPAENAGRAVTFRGATDDVAKDKGVDLYTPTALYQLGVAFADGFVQAGQDEHLEEMAQQLGVPMLKTACDETTVAALEDFFLSVADGQNA